MAAAHSLDGWVKSLLQLVRKSFQSQACTHNEAKERICEAGERRCGTGTHPRLHARRAERRTAHLDAGSVGVLRQETVAPEVRLKGVLVDVKVPTEKRAR